MATRMVDQELLNIKEIRGKLYYDWSFKQDYGLFEEYKKYQRLNNGK
jgi:hypothetical protein